MAATFYLNIVQILGRWLGQRYFVLRRAKPVSKGRPIELNCPCGSRRLIRTSPPHQHGPKPCLNENRYSAESSLWNCVAPDGELWDNSGYQESAKSVWKCQLDRTVPLSSRSMFSSPGRHSPISTFRFTMENIDAMKLYELLTGSSRRVFVLITALQKQCIL